MFSEFREAPVRPPPEYAPVCIISRLTLVVLLHYWRIHSQLSGMLFPVGGRLRRDHGMMRPTDE